MGIAFFDMDRTLLSVSSGIRFVRFLWGKQLVRFAELINVLVISTQYTLNFMDFPKAMATMSRRIKGGDAQAITDLCNRWFEEDLVRFITPKAVQRLREHQQRGDTTILLSASTQFVVEPVARYLQIPYCCTELEIVNNQFTGEVVGNHCYGEGKRYWGERLAQEHNTALQDCTFYTDSYSDRALLLAVGHPVAINPDGKLRSLARAKGWPIEYFY